MPLECRVTPRSVGIPERKNTPRVQEYLASLQVYPFHYGNPPPHDSAGKHPQVQQYLQNLT